MIVRRPTVRRRTVRRSAATAWYDGQLLRPDRWMPPEVYRRQTNPGIRRLLVVHPPKTGGSSLRSMLAAHVPRARTSLSTGQHQWVGETAEDTRDTELFVGHQFLEPLYRYPADDWVTVLALREPLAWWRSWYKWRRTLLRDAGSFVDPISVVSMADWVDSRPDAELSNPQASWLLARTRVMFDSTAALPGRIAALGASLAESPGPAVDVLARLLAAITVLGPTEDLFGVYARTCAAMGWEERFTRSVRENISAQAPELLELRPDQVERLRSLNGLDSWLHERAVRAAAATTAT